MSKQIDIKDGLKRILVDDHLVTATLSFLEENGVVIKVERELPRRIYHDRFMTGAGQWNKEGKDTGYKDARQDMLKAGYVAVELLIKDK